ncbi:MAG: hypothetical protein KBH81_15290, partial [Phycisphaerae bacterium]|nr:hypothetical protein [Phycisphaerae bacterium]
SASFDAHGSAGAAYCGVFGADIAWVTISCDVDFAIGEFALACACEPLYRACCYEAVMEASCEIEVDIMDCIATGGRWDINVFACEEFDPPCGEYMGACCYGAIADPGYEPWQCMGDYLQWECLYLSEYTNWTGGASCSDPFFMCPGTPTYCDASGGCDEYIGRVQVGDIDNSSSCDRYADYTTIWTRWSFRACSTRSPSPTWFQSTQIEHTSADQGCQIWPQGGFSSSHVAYTLKRRPTQSDAQTPSVQLPAASSQQAPPGMPHSMPNSPIAKSTPLTQVSVTVSTGLPHTPIYAAPAEP